MSVIPRPRGRGPVEAGSNGTAPPPSPPAFRARAGAAPLKPLNGAELYGAVRSFRARAGAAPLKQGRPGTEVARHFFIPRPRGRGPVEAVATIAVVPLPPNIPRPRGRGPVEAFRVEDREPRRWPPFRARAGAAPLKPVFQSFSDRHRYRIPRPRGRGPVEAAVTASWCPFSRRTFRARAGAAPLKPDLAGEPVPPPLGIPRPRGRGPVEACRFGVEGSGKLSTFRARAGAAPLKLDEMSDMNRTISHSAPARARPR